MVGSISFAAQVEGCKLTDLGRTGFVPFLPNRKMLANSKADSCMFRTHVTTVDESGGQELTGD